MGHKESNQTKTKKQDEDQPVHLQSDQHLYLLSEKRNSQVCFNKKIQASMASVTEQMGLETGIYFVCVFFLMFFISILKVRWCSLKVTV